VVKSPQIFTFRIVSITRLAHLLPLGTPVTIVR